MKKQKYGCSNIDKSPESLAIQVDHFSSLPDEIILNIFRGLSKRDLKYCSRVCRRWQQISNDHQLGLWDKVTIECETISLTSLAMVIERGVRVLRIFQSTILDPDSKESPFTENYVSQLQTFIASYPKISQLSLALILERTTQLERLDISRYALNKRIAEAISKNTRLKFLRLPACSHLDQKVMITILKGCNKLEDLGLCATRLTVETLDSTIAHLSPSLRHLDIRYLGPTLVDRHLPAIFQACPQLQTLEILGNTGLTASQ